ncbi:LuxR C-terminal-related transcriptional regulator [Chloroflexota bacterium]
MNRKSVLLTREERDVLILGAIHLDSKQLSNADIGQRLGLAVNRVKMLIHRACVKLEAHSRNEAIFLAVKRGEINLDEIYSLDEIAERFRSLGPYMLRRIAYMLRQGSEFGYFPEKDKPIIRADRREDSILTQTERDVLILAGYGLPNKEIAGRLCISISSVGTFLYRACTKLGACKRADAVMLAVRSGEISVLDIFSPDDLMQVLAPLGADSVEKMAQLMDRKPGREPILTGI